MPLINRLMILIKRLRLLLKRISKGRGRSQPASQKPASQQASKPPAMFVAEVALFTFPFCHVHMLGNMSPFWHKLSSSIRYLRKIQYRFKEHCVQIEQPETRIRSQQFIKCEISFSPSMVWDDRFLERMFENN